MLYRALLSQILLIILCAPLPGLAVDLGPLDIIAPQPEWRTISAAIRYSDRDQRIVDGTSQPGSYHYKQTDLIIRPGMGFQLHQMPGYVFAEMGYRSIETGGLLAQDPLPMPGAGVTDLTLAAGVWPLVDRKRGRYLGIGGYLLLPTGDYDSQRTHGINLNPGGNRVAGALQLDYNQTLSRRWNWMGAADVAFFGDNDAYLGASLAAGTLEQRPLYSLQTALTWHQGPRFSLAVSYYYSQGGEMRSHGSDWDSEIKTHRYALWGLWRLDRKTRLNLRYGSSLDVENGLKEQHLLQLKLIRFF